MSKFIVAAASTADLTVEYLDEHNIPFIMYPYSVGDKSFMDDCKQETRALSYKMMRAGEPPATAMINEFQYLEFFEKLMSEGKDVIYLDMTKKISSSFTQAQKAAEKIQEKYPNQTFYLMDTLCVSGGLGMLLHYIRILRDEGKTLDEAVEWAEANKRRIIHWFTVDDLNFLKRGGRVSNAAAAFGTLLNIKPVLFVDNEGHLVVGFKIRGRKKALLTILERMKADFTDPDGKEVFINHADCLDDALFMKEKIRETFPTVGEITVMSLGAVVGAHCGPGLLTIFYLGGERFR